MRQYDTTANAAYRVPLVVSRRVELFNEVVSVSVQVRNTLDEQECRTDELIANRGLPYGSARCPLRRASPTLAIGSNGD